MIREIITVDDDYGKATLSRACIAVPADPIVVSKLFKDLSDTAVWASRRHPLGCIGLSANQIGYPYTAFVMRWGSEFIPVMNPELMETSYKTAPSREGCVSRPQGPPILVKRWKWLVLQWTDPYTMEVCRRKFRKVDARVVQHEMDHGNGILI